MYVFISRYFSEIFSIGNDEGEHFCQIEMEENERKFQTHFTYDEVFSI